MKAEQVFIARGHSFTNPRTASRTGDPKARQKVQRGKVISFPQNSARALAMLPLAVDEAAESFRLAAVARGAAPRAGGPAPWGRCRGPMSQGIHGLRRARCGHGCSTKSAQP